MKLKITGAVLCVLLILLCVAAPLGYTKVENRYHQHLEAAEKAPCTDHGAGELCSHLPLVVIDTGKNVIPGEPLDKVNGVRQYTTAPDGSATIPCNIKTIDNSDTNNHLTDRPSINTVAQIRVRGHSSRLFDKKSYAIRTINTDGSNKDVEFCGMDAHHEWVLHGPFLDKTLIRNYMCYNLAGEMMDYAPNCRFCEVVLNGEYQGLYLAVEKITAGDDGTRLNLKSTKKHQQFLSYLVRVDRGIETPDDDITKLFPLDTQIYRLHPTLGYNIEYPGRQNLNEEKVKEITRDLSKVIKILYSYDYTDDDYGYANYLNTDSFVDYFLINEITLNYDAGTYSTYVYKDINGKLNMCVWDFNNACDNYQEQKIQSTDFRLNGTFWYERLLKDPVFTKKLLARYHELRNGIFSDEYLDSYIDEVIDYLGPAIDRNYKVWGYVWDDNVLLYPAERNLHSYDEAVAQLKNSLHKRLNWLDNNIESLRQFSEQSGNKRYNVDAY